jgi:hypothetical protein
MLVRAQAIDQAGRLPARHCCARYLLPRHYRETPLCLWRNRIKSEGWRKPSDGKRLMGGT